MKVILFIVALVLLLCVLLFYTPFILMFLTVNGRSMLPTFVEGDNLWSVRSYLCKIRVGDVVVAKPYKCNNKLVIKRVHSIKNGYYYLLGDNADESYDSRNYGWVSKKEIVAKVMKCKS